MLIHFLRPYLFYRKSGNLQGFYTLLHRKYIIREKQDKKVTVELVELNIFM